MKSAASFSANYVQNSSSPVGMRNHQVIRIDSTNGWSYSRCNPRMKSMKALNSVWGIPVQRIWGRVIPQESVEMDQRGSTTEFICGATFLRVRRWRDVIFFLRMSSGVQKQLKGTSGLVRYGLRANFLRKRYWTYSVWADRASVDAFLRAEPHRTAMRRLSQWIAPGDAAFVTWESTDDSINWKEGLDRLNSSSHGASA